MEHKLDYEFLSSIRITLSLSRDDLASKHELQHWDLGPLLQGSLMEQIDTSYAERLHGMPFNPYSQHCEIEGGSVVWVINTLTNKAHDSIIQPILHIPELHIKKLGLSLKLGEYQESRITRRSLADLVYKDNNASKFTLKFLTPTAFKSGGAYQTIPNMKFIYQNLVMRYGYVFESDREADPETLEYLASHTRIAKYSLHSRSFLLSGKRIPAFMGQMTVDVSGSQTLRGFAHMLFRFGEFGGMGIKTSMGMGGMSVE